ncbi:hypothetical protein GRX03_01095 [Halovenus sp. WSH3]|uniref:Uncharacterized protein n=1 Tax=Halovenus carboxidivorans TaxID=2692199 RepID=A0A6B0SYG5_9EURY|nr:hypothetical protein [Halovenus carboxidivorans]MXR50207.1 hypothetical protein [Halovenus carboxidivorans]
MNEEERLRREIRAVKEAIDIHRKEEEVYGNDFVELRAEEFRREFSGFQHLLNVNPEKLEEHRERLQRDLEVLRGER